MEKKEIPWRKRERADNLKGFVLSSNLAVNQDPIKFPATKKPTMTLIVSAVNNKNSCKKIAIKKATPAEIA